VKHIGCRLAQAGIEVERPVRDYLDGRSAGLTTLEMRFEIWGDIVTLYEHLRFHGEDFGGFLSMGDLYCMYRPSTGAISEVQGFLSNRWLRLNYLYDLRIRHPRGSFRRNRVSLPCRPSMDPSAVERECEECKAKQG
jgi:hypothetical protein